jgi:hypothetical protein
MGDRIYKSLLTQHNVTHLLAPAITQSLAFFFLMLASKTNGGAGLLGKTCTFLLFQDIRGVREAIALRLVDDLGIIFSHQPWREKIAHCWVFRE